MAEKQHGVISRRQLLDAGLGPRSISRWVEGGRLFRVYRQVYAYGRPGLAQRGEWLAAVMACGEDAVLSHRSAAALWELMPSRLLEVTASRRREAPGIAIHECGVHKDERMMLDGIAVTTPSRTILDLAEVVDEKTLRRAFEEADRRRLLTLKALERVYARGHGRRALRPLRHLLDDAWPPATRSPLEDRVVALCREHGLPPPKTNVIVDGREVDAYWPDAKLMVEADSFEFHGHRAAFERDRARDAAMQVAGYRVIRLTHRRLTHEPINVAEELRELLARDVPRLRDASPASPSPRPGAGGEVWPPGSSLRMGRRRRLDAGQGTVEWIALLGVVALLLLSLLAAGVRLPGAALARQLSSKLLCAAALAERCGDEPVLIAVYGDEVGRLAREHMPSIAFERGSRALPVDFRRCRRTGCGDGSARGLVERSDRGLPVTAFVHVIDCRDPEPDARPNCSGERAGNLYIQYWLYYADSATMRGVPLVRSRGYHRDDWESVQVRIGPDGAVDERASSHRAYNHAAGAANAGADAGIDALRGLAEALGARPRNGWGPSEGLLRVSGGSHAGNAEGYFELDRIAPAPSILLVPLEPIVAAGRRHRFAVTPPWHKRAWTDPEATGTD